MLELGTAADLELHCDCALGQQSAAHLHTLQAQLLELGVKCICFSRPGGELLFDMLPFLRQFLDPVAGLLHLLAALPQICLDSLDTCLDLIDSLQSMQHCSVYRRGRRRNFAQNSASMGAKNTSFRGAQSDPSYSLPAQLPASRVLLRG
jgi:hypothetical protein